jgi:transposase InsO family protein
VIASHVGQYPIGLMCRVMKVSYAGFWCWRRDPVGRRERANKRLLALISEVFLESGRTYGSPRIYEELKKRGETCSREHIAYLMRKHGLRSRHYKRPRGLTQVDRCRKAAPNLVDQYFEVEEPNAIWVADITYVPTDEGWLYLAAVMDLCTRKVVGWSLKDTLETEIALEAFDRAVAVENPGRDLIHHSDRGVQYSSLRYQQRLWSRGMMCSMSRKGNCYDNAVMESFFHTLKVERSDWKKYRTKQEAAADLNWWIGVWYNQRRLHSSLGYKSPNEYGREKNVA